MKKNVRTTGLDIHKLLHIMDQGPSSTGGQGDLSPQTFGQGRHFFF